NNSGTNMQYSIKLTNLWENHQFRYGLQFEDISYSRTRHRTGPPLVLFNGQVSDEYRVDVSFNNENEKVYEVDAWPPNSEWGQTSSKYLDWFAQDSWNLTPALNITAGVRWEQQQIKEEREGHGFALNNNWAPRIGATYDYLKNGKSK